MEIKKVSKVVSDYIKSSFGNHYRITSVRKEGEVWNAKAEIFEDSELIKTLGLNSNAKDKNQYSFQLDANLDVVGYEKMNLG